MLYVTFGDIKEGRMREYQDWVKKNEGPLGKHAPRGWIYRGTWGSVFGFGEHDIAQMWEIKNYGDLDAARDHTDATFERLGEEGSEFFLPGSGQSILLREVGDLRITEPKKPKK